MQTKWRTSVSFVDFTACSHPSGLGGGVGGGLGGRAGHSLTSLLSSNSRPAVMVEGAVAVEDDFFLKTSVVQMSSMVSV